MLKFKPLTIDDKALFDSYIKPYKFLTCEYSFITLYTWRKASNIEYCIFKDALIIKKNNLDSGSFFMQPIGYREEYLEAIIEALIDYKKNNDMSYLFNEIEESFLDELQKLTKFNFIINKDDSNFDYIYESEQLIKLPGRKLSSKRNHINKFISTYDYRIEEITEDNKYECIEVSKAWCIENGASDLMLYEHESIIDLLNYKEILEFDGIVVYVDDKLSGFSIGEKLNMDMAIIHVEKASSNINGLYSFINKSFAEKCYKGVKLINREDDMGLEGLRKAKESYRPCKLEYKYTVKLI